ncbi:SbcC/MukB-like Walker B domain-containing protein [Sporosarcina sp. Marseille-Q4943]|uniref:SbcC/MukB-like Walker B domain-containing protein n=1 Tax=Sporosarcina sp. Marseille-Q4943 TaxID=2942204 RepID=UPI00208DB666|nr:SMC family ATPase [Sporosarcina sp. Marseille-Q4943]
MKPIQLTMTAFGPYKGTETIDFRQLEEHRLFVVSGATGAGKTTIFDGICFALYGQASGEDRTEFRSMRSDFADDAVQTAVKLIFEINGRTFRIMRQIPYTKSGNKTETPARCEFFELVDGGEVPFVDRQIVSEINRKVEELVGFTQAQFSQIVMLPQGEFRKFLTSDTENKETIMRKIFKTEEYREIVNRLKTRKDEAHQQLMDGKRKVDGYIHQIPNLIPPRESLLFEVLSQEYSNTSQVMDALEQEIVHYVEKCAADEKKYTAAYQKHAEILDAYHAAKKCNEQFEQLEQRKIVLGKLTDEIPSVELKQKRIEDAERASVIHEIEGQFRMLAEDAKTKENEFQKALIAVQEATNHLEEKKIAYKEEEEKEQDRGAVTERLIRLRDHLPAVTDLAAKEANVLALKLKIGKMEGEFRSVTEKAETEKKRLADLNVNVEKFEQAISPYDKLIEELNTIRMQYKVVRDYENIKKDYAVWAEKKEAASNKFIQTKNEFEMMQNAWLNDQAAHLAQTLKEGEPCPVCGSAHHPSKVAGHDNNAVSREELDLKRSYLAEVESAFRSAEAKCESVLAQITEKEQEMNDLQINEGLEVLFTKGQNAAEKVEQLRKMREELASLKEQQKRADKESNEWLTRKSELEQALFQQKTIFAQEAALLDRELSAIPEGLRDLSRLQAEIQETESRKRQMDEAWQSVRKRLEEARERLATSINSQNHLKTALDECIEKRDRADDRFKKALQASEFNTEEEYRQAKMTEGDRLLLKDYVMQFKHRLHATKEAINELEAGLIGKEKTDLDSLIETIQTLKSAYEKAFADWNNSIECEKALTRLKSDIEKTAKDVEDLEKEVGKITGLYDVIRGQNDYKLSFERFIQIDYLERIIQSANERLRNLSNGQYELVRSDRQEMRGRQSGLGLDVYDAYTGQSRDVKTLSGGEKFNASLSLALGMADVIQSYQGAVSIETMFIDEGFGTLDEEALQKAVDTLVDLQKSGRMIGVISHVEELKTAFPAILEVQKSKEGHSVTRFVLK